MSSFDTHDRRQRALDREKVLGECRFFAVEDAMRWVIAAYREATAAMQPAPGEPWIDADGTACMSPLVFAEVFEFEVVRRLVQCSVSARVFSEEAVTPSWRIHRLILDRVGSRVGAVADEAQADRQAFADREQKSPGGKWVRTLFGESRFVVAQEHELPLCGKVDVPVQSAGAANAT